jgi:hypothetical protein
VLLLAVVRVPDFVFGVAFFLAGVRFTAGTSSSSLSF